MQKSKSDKGKGAEDGAVLQQALRDRDEAIEKWVHAQSPPKLQMIQTGGKEGSWKVWIYFKECVIFLCSAVQEEGDGGRAAAEQNRVDAAEQPAAGGRAETSGAVAGARELEGKRCLTEIEVNKPNRGCI